LKLYNELAEWWPLFSPPSDYDEEAAELLEIIDRTVQPAPETMLELGSGGGSIAFHFKRRFRMTLTDLSEQMLAQSRTYNPECEHLQGDMRSLRLGRTFDAVFVHDAIMFMTNEQDLFQCMQTAHAHCKPGGTAIFVPDHVRETYVPQTTHDGKDSGERSLRCLEWHFDPNPTDTVCEVHYAFLLRRGSEVYTDSDHQHFGLFPRGEWLRLLERAGFLPQALTDSYERPIFIAKKPAA
jgi:SAM-dependent methyltransferase